MCVVAVGIGIIVGNKYHNFSVEKKSEENTKRCVWNRTLHFSTLTYLP